MVRLSPSQHINDLYEALERLRDYVLQRVIRIDVLCINQEDDWAKSRQVQAMPMIYANASRVSIWLVDLGEDGEAALGFTQYYSSGETAPMPKEKKVRSS